MGKKVIWKYELKERSNGFSVPINSLILSVQAQRNIVCLWVEVDPDYKASVTRGFELIFTGEQYDHSNKTYIGTTQVDDGHLVVHVFENHLR